MELNVASNEFTVRNIKRVFQSAVFENCAMDW